ncbi:MAG: cysteine hydrolase [Clostridiaceae bacterium]|jgi:nicotinamidase-related amidase|nr:cysteine hydrolase [Clostridiaceae bacterium]
MTNKNIHSLNEINSLLEKLPVIRLEDLESEKSALIIVDMINGFIREGPMMSERVEAIIPEIVELSKKCDKLKIQKIAFADNHTDASPEFDSYPRHCLKGTSESEIVDEIKAAGGYVLIPKNSTNGFLEEAFQKWLNTNDQTDTFIITGCCTDICVQQFAITLKTWFNKNNRYSRIIVPVNAVETYDLGPHDAELTNTMALYNMLINGVEVVKEVE